MDSPPWAALIARLQALLQAVQGVDEEEGEKGSKRRRGFCVSLQLANPQRLCAGVMQRLGSTRGEAWSRRRRLGSDDRSSSSNLLATAAGSVLTTFRTNALAGALAGGLVSCSLHPVDTIKTIVQAEHGQRRSMSRILHRIMNERGIKGLYRGLGSNLATAAPISAIYTTTYESVKERLLPLLPAEYAAVAHCVAGGCASVATSFVFTPSECIKQRMQVGGMYSNSAQAALGILKQEGLRGLYAGWGAVLCRNVPQSIIKFLTYEQLKKAVAKDGTPPTTLQTLAIGGMAGSTAAFFTTPFDVAKTRLQTQIPGVGPQYSGVYDALRQILATEGIQGLYRGVAPRLIIYVSQGAIFFASYELLKAILHHQQRVRVLAQSQPNAAQHNGSAVTTCSVSLAQPRTAVGVMS
eukprot:jgi/Chlat1/439/Chrsp103S01018